MTIWHATLEWTARLHPAHEDVVDALLLELRDHHVGAVSFPDLELHRWGTTFCVETPTIQEAADTALQMLRAAAGKAGQHGVTVLGLDVVDEAGHEVRLITPTR